MERMQLRLRDDAQRPEELTRWFVQGCAKGEAVGPLIGRSAPLIFGLGGGLGESRGADLETVHHVECFLHREYAKISVGLMDLIHCAL